MEQEFRWLAKLKFMLNPMDPILCRWQLTHLVDAHNARRSITQGVKINHDTDRPREGQQVRKRKRKTNK